MPRAINKYLYEAIDKDGNQQSGIMPAETLEEAALKILQEELYPSRIEELKGTALIAQLRLDNLKRLRDVASRGIKPPEIKPPKTPIKHKKGNFTILVAIAILLWIAAAVIIALSGGP